MNMQEMLLRIYLANPTHKTRYAGSPLIILPNGIQVCVERNPDGTYVVYRYKIGSIWHPTKSKVVIKDILFQKVLNRNATLEEAAQIIQEESQREPGDDGFKDISKEPKQTITENRSPADRTTKRKKDRDSTAIYDDL